MRDGPRLARAAASRGRRRDGHRRRRDAGDAGRGRGRRSAGSRRARPRRRGRAPLRPASVDAFFAAGLLGHVPDPARLLQSLASFRAARAPGSRCSNRSGAPRSRRATNGRCSPTSCSIRRSCPACSRGGLDDRDARRRRIALPRDRGVAPSRSGFRATSPCSSTSSRSRAIGTGGSPARCARTR